MRALLRTVPAEPEEPADFAAARQRWQAAWAQRRALVDRLAGARAALGQLEREEGAPPFGPRLVEAAERFLNGRVLSGRQLRREIEDAEDALAAAAAEHAREAAAWRQAAAAEAARRATELRPRHRAAVAKIAAAVEALSAAVEAERALRRELADSEVGAYASLPDGSQGLGTLGEWHGQLSTWARHVRQLGLLD
jgi:hypothetical protein